MASLANSRMLGSRPFTAPGLKAGLMSPRWLA